MKRGNLVLIGMPSSGKSTIGEALAKKLRMAFIDTDSIIQQRKNKALRDIVNEEGLEEFLRVQETCILELEVENHIIATGGSVVYGKAAMEYLKERGTIVYLELTYSEIENRIASGRRFARNENQSFLDIYHERVPLYEKYADVTVACSGKDVEGIVGEIQALVQPT